MYWPSSRDHQLREEECHILIIHSPKQLCNKTAEKEQRRRLITAIIKDYTKQPFKIDTTDTGKPYLDTKELQFNLSHSNNILVLAISHFAVGIDIEFMKKKDYQGFSKYFWGEDLISMYPRYTQRLAFFHAWTQTEAWVKYHGETIFNHLDFTPTKLLSRDPLTLSSCQMVSFMPCVNAVASLCYDQRIQTIILKQLDWQAYGHDHE